jgi:poly(beta-D-mannuronate) lyase
MAGIKAKARRGLPDGRGRVVSAGLALVASAFGGEMFGADPIPAGELRGAVKRAQPGEVIVVSDGTYTDLALEIEGSGSKDQPVTIRAATPGGVIFSGRSGIELKGDHLVLDGFYFNQGHSPEKYVVDIAGSHCRLTNTVIDGYNPPDPEAREDKWVSLRGQHHRVDHCTFHNKTSRSVTLTVWRAPGVPDHHVIEFNHFHTRPKGAKGNGYETIRIGTSEESESDSFTVVRSNLFEKCDGEMETVSVKSGACHLQDNTFAECAGTLTLRHGRGSRVERNLFAGKRKEGTGGVRVYGAGHVVRGNAFIGLAGRGGGALSLMAGEKDPKLNGYQRVESALIEGNLMAANLGPAIRLDEQYGEDDRTLLPSGVTVRANVLSGTDLEGLVAGGERALVGLVWDRNQVFAANQIPKDITTALAPPLTKGDVGAPWFRARLP